MGVKAGLTLKAVQWFFRGVQFSCAIIILGIYSYFLATLASNNLPIAHSTRAVEGIAGSAALYSLLALMFLCCLAGFAVTSALAILLDLAFIGAFLYVAVVNRRGAGACRGYSDTPLGAGDAAGLLSGDGDAGLSLPKLCTACRLQSASLGVAIIAIFFFSFSIATEFALVRNRRRLNRYEPGLAEVHNTGVTRPRGIFTRRNNPNKAAAAGYPADQANILPEHAHPDQLRSSLGSETVDPAYAKYETGYGHHGHVHSNPLGNVRGNVHEDVHGNVRGNAPGGNVRGNVHEDVHGNVHSNVHANAHESVHGNVGNVLGNALRGGHRGGHHPTSYRSHDGIYDQL